MSAFSLKASTVAKALDLGMGEFEGQQPLHVFAQEVGDLSIEIFPSKNKNSQDPKKQGYYATLEVNGSQFFAKSNKEAFDLAKAKKHNELQILFFEEGQAIFKKGEAPKNGSGKVKIG